jgi:hypothetical protein
MRRGIMLIVAGSFALALAGCGQTEQARENLAKAGGEWNNTTGNEVVLGGYDVDGPTGKIEVPEARAERGAVEKYMNDVRPVVDNTIQDLTRIIQLGAQRENQTLTLSVPIAPIERDREATREGLEQLRKIYPPGGLEPVHERLLNAYERALSDYDNIVGAYNSQDVNTLAEAARQSLPEIGQANAESRSILQ